MKTVLNVVLSAALVATLSACELAVDLVGGGSADCSWFNAPEDRFQLYLDDSEVLLTVEEERTLQVRRSWLDSQLNRVELDCRPAWVVEPADLATVSLDGVVVGTGFGTGVVTAMVTGSGGTKTDSAYLAVVPAVTETEPNNGIPAAEYLEDGHQHVGLRDYAGDIDWFRATLPAGASLQFTLTPAISLDVGFWSYSAYGSVYDSSERYITEANRTVTNSSEVPQDVYLRVSPGGVIPYRVQLDLFD